MSRIIEFRKSAQKAEKQSVQGKTCAFTGHRPQSLPFGFDESDKRCTSLKSVMRDQIVALIENEGVTHFITGMALGVDMYAAEIVLDLKSKYPHITLESAIPCETQAIKWSVASRERYYNIAAKCDKETMLQREYTPDCMDKRNRHMVDHADYILAVWNGCPSGTGNTVRYAHKKGKSIIVIVADGLFCREIDGLFCRSSPDIIVRRRCVLSHKRRGWLQPSPSFRYSRNLALQDELYHPVINNGPAVLVCVDKRLGTGPVNQSRDAG